MKRPAAYLLLLTSAIALWTLFPARVQTQLPEPPPVAIHTDAFSVPCDDGFADEQLTPPIVSSITRAAREETHRTSSRKLSTAPVRLTEAMLCGFSVTQCRRVPVAQPGATPYDADHIRFGVLLI